MDILQLNPGQLNARPREPQAPSDNNANGTRPGTRTGDSPSGEPISSTGADSTRDLVTRQDPSALRYISPPRIGTAEFYDRQINQLVRPPNSFLFDRYADDTALTIRVLPDVGPEAERAAWQQRIPNRLQFIKEVLLE